MSGFLWASVFEDRLNRPGWGMVYLVVPGDGNSGVGEGRVLKVQGFVSCRPGFNFESSSANSPFSILRKPTSLNRTFNKGMRACISEISG